MFSKNPFSSFIYWMCKLDTVIIKLRINLATAISPWIRKGSQGRRGTPRASPLSSAVWGHGSARSLWVLRTTSLSTCV